MTERLREGTAGVTDTALPGIAPPSCPFPDRISPHAEQAERHLRGYLRQCGIFRGQDAAAYYDESRLGYLTAQIYPDALPERLLVLAEWYGVWTVFDDQLEKLADLRPPEAVSGVAAAMLSWLPTAALAPAADAPAAPADAADAVPFARGFGEAWQRLRAATSPAWQRRFLAHTVEYLEGCHWEAANRSLGAVPELAEYIARRRRFGGIRMAMDLSEYGRGYELPPQTHADPVIGELLDVLGDITLWGNDIFSVLVDREEGNVSNLVFVLQRHRGCGLAEAAAEASRMLDERFARLRAIEAALRAWQDARGLDTRERTHLDYFVTGVHTWISGNVYWSLANSRYRTARPRVGGEQPNFLLDLGQATRGGARGSS
jgi:Terpene synthase family 2, C-terminal metal binding